MNFIKDVRELLENIIKKWKQIDRSLSWIQGINNCFFKYRIYLKEDTN